MDLEEVLGIDASLAASISDVLPEWMCRHPGGRCGRATVASARARDAKWACVRGTVSCGALRRNAAPRGARRAAPRRAWRLGAWRARGAGARSAAPRRSGVRTT
jgi:hypothetical protein